MKFHRRTRALSGFLAAAILAGGAPAFAASELEEIRDTQKKILQRLDAQDRILKDIQGRLPRAQAQPDPNEVYDIPVAHSPVKGPKTARVTIAEFSDFQWPFCAQSTSLVDQLLKAYPKDVRFTYKQMPLTQIHRGAMPAAKASIAAGNQGKFWEMHDKLFENYRLLNDEATFAKLAKEIGLDLKKFEKDMAAPETEKLVQADMELAQKVGVRGTPTFYINGKRVMNRSVEGMKAMIDAELKTKDK